MSFHEDQVVLMESMGMLYFANRQVFYPVTHFISCEDGGFYIFTMPPCCCLLMKDIRLGASNSSAASGLCWNSFIDLLYSMGFGVES